MQYLFLISATLLVLAGGLGFFWRRGILTLMLSCLGLSFVIGFGLQMRGDPPHNGRLSYEYVVSTLFWFVIPYILFFLIPALAGGMLGFVAKRRGSRFLRRPRE